ncbi:O-linked N-acetylglucosamine transferase, SPINDLY family protein [Azospirillum picis]|uniref:protein O-GlcNAc transferase n=1 Tax=Azospirillum picis TaxID=488438 RepID=A0ABU0MHZ8_9PROT|nr:tetratricopeptide repeat protein [Azospirillum picis]MBP2299309.1 putative O-linked N-acetylglucosamine transferase (SPINDLY family) [Azospirillum picis]MDQ0533053.1 putative O-linked N-acetylglucosamine transferase (SPINDLY family) [Azospirillum picis]
MATIQEALNAALAYHQAGRLAEAAALYHAVLDAAPGHADAAHLLGVVHLQSGEPERAAALIRTAIQANHRVADYHDNLGSALKALGRPEDAAAAHRQALRLRPDFAQALYNLGNALEALGRLDEAAAAFRQAAARKPGYAKARFNLGNVLAALGRREEADSALRAAVADDPGFVEAHANRGQLLLAMSRPADAAATLARALALRPDHAPALANLAAALLALGEREAAERAARRAVAVRPDRDEALLRLGEVLQQGNRLGKAAEVYAAALVRNPALAEAHASLALVRQIQGLLDAAEAGNRRALALDPGLADVRSNLAYLQLFRPGVTLAAVLAAHRDWDAVHGAPHRGHWARPRRSARGKGTVAVAAKGKAAAQATAAAGPLTVAILSGDFRRHPAGLFAVRTVEALPAQGIRLALYANQTDSDDVTDRFRRAAERWIPVAGLSDAELAARIRQDRPDVLIDLAGHNARGRPGVFARKPAAVQVAWSGYMATTGLAAMDALVADRHHVPEGMEPFYTERILRLPGAFIAYDPPGGLPVEEEALALTPPPCLTGAPVTFGYFNILTKLNDAVLAAWAAIFARLPQARLLMKTKALSCPDTAALWRARLTAAGIAPDRVTMAGGSSSLDHMRHCALVDVALDPFPFSGSTTTLETMWMGVPVVTLPGETFSSRHSLAFLSVAGVEGCVAADPAAYVERAVAWASDPQGLAELRRTLRARMAEGPLCDGPRQAIALAGELRRLCAGDA